MSHGILEVKIPIEKNRVINDPLNNLFQTTSPKIEKEMEVLKTFHVNKKVIENMNLQNQFFIKNNYRYQELYKESIPIRVSYKRIHPKLINRLIKLIPESNHKQFRLEIPYSIKERVISKIKGTELIKFNNEDFFEFGEILKNNLIEMSIDKIGTVSEPIYFKFIGDEHTVYESIIKHNLTIQQLNIHAPLIEISYTDTVPKRGTEYVNQLIETFLDKNIDNKITTNTKILDFIQQQMDKTKKKFELSEKSLENYKSNKRVLNPTLQSNITIEQLNKIEIKLFEVKLKKRLVDNALKSLNRGENFSSIGPALVELSDRATLSLIEVLNNLELKENQLSQEYTLEFPELQQTRIDIKNIQHKIYKNIKSLRSSIYNQEHTLIKMKKKFEKNLSMLPEEETKLINLNRNHEVYSKMLEYLLKKKAENDMLKVVNISDYKIIEKAYIPEQPFKPKRGILLLLSIIFGFGFGIMIALLHYKLHQKITSLDDIELSNNLDIYGYLPSIKSAGYIEAYKQNPSEYLNSLRKIRRDIELMDPKNKSKTILLSSISKNAGKTRTATNLAAIFQKAQFKTILIDLNLENPSLHKYFNIIEKSSQGNLIDYLNEEKDISDIVLHTSFKNLDIISSKIGTTSNTSELLLLPKMAELLNELKKEYKYIIIDTAAIQAVAETILIMKQVDINLILLRKNYSKREEVEKIEKLIHKYKIKNSGLILNEFNIEYNDI
jgi:capsular exopolysaccharide synthesis family protein